MLPPLRFARLDAPIVLAHGLFGFTRIGIGRLTVTSYFRGIPHALAEDAGNRVLVTRVPPIAGTEKRARRLADQIDRTFPDEPIHLIGHSMGGLDARRMLADRRMAAARSQPDDNRHAAPGDGARRLRQVARGANLPAVSLSGN